MAGFHQIGAERIGEEPISGEFVILSPIDPGQIFTARNSVGRIYEVGINGVGYMLADTADSPNYERTASQVELPRFATGDTPFSEAVDRYTFVPFADFSDGAGQQFRDRPDSSDKAFWDSRRLDPFSEPGRLKPLKSLASFRAMTARDTATNYLSKPDIPIVFLQNGEGLYLDDDDLLSLVSDGSDLLTGTTLYSMHSNGVTALIARSDGSFRSTILGAAATTPTVNNIATIGGTAVVTHCIYWSTVAQRWCVGVAGNGVVGFTTLTGSATPFTNEMGANIYRFSATTGGSTKTAVVRSITDGGGYVWFAVTDFPQGALNAIYAWRAGSADAPTVAYNFSDEECVLSVFYGGSGNLFARVLAPRGTGDIKTVQIWRFIQQGAQLVPVRVLDLGSLDQTTTTGTLFRGHLLGGWAAYGNRVFFGWKDPQGAGTYGVGCIDLATGGYAKWWDVDTAAADAKVVDGIAFDQNGVPHVLIPGASIYQANGAPTTGFLLTSAVDLASSVSKRVDSVALTAQAQSAGGGGSIRVLGLLSTTSPAFDITDHVTQEILQQVASHSTIERRPNLTLETFLLRIEVTPAIDTYHEKTVVRLHPLGLVDEVLQMVVNCADNQVGLSGASLAGNGPGAGARRSRELQALTQTIIDFQDLDWQPGDEMEKWEVLSVKTPARNTRQALTGKASQHMTATVTLRRHVR